LLDTFQMAFKQNKIFGKRLPYDPNLAIRRRLSLVVVAKHW